MPATFLYEARLVGVEGVSPPSGPLAGGTAITISGRHFTAAGAGALAVTIGGIAATAIVLVDDARITCVTPAHAVGAADAVVTNADGAVGTLVAGFTYEAAPPPASLIYRAAGGGMARQVRLLNPAPTINQTIGQPWTASFTTGIEPQGYAPVMFSAFGVVLFDGIITNTTGRSEGRQKRPVWDAAATNHAYLLGRRYPVGRWDAVAGEVVLGALMAGWGLGFGTAIEGGLSPVTMDFDGSTDLWTAIVQVCDSCGAKCFLVGTVLHVFTVDAGFDPPGMVTDASPDLLYPSSGQAVTVEYDYTQIRNRVTVRGAEGLAVTLEDAASIGRFGVCEFPINDDTLTTTNDLAQRARVELAAYAQPVPTIHYATRDLKTMAGKTVAVSVSSPAIVGTFVIQSVRIDQMQRIEAGERPRFTVTASPATTPMYRAAGTLGTLQTVVDLAANANKQPRLAGDIVSAPGGRTEIPAGSIPASKLAGCIESDLLADTDVVAGTYGDGAHLAGFTVNAKGQLVAAATDPVPVAKTDGSQPFTADQSMGGNQVTNVGAPAAGTDAANKTYVDAAVAAGISGPIAWTQITGTPTTLAGYGIPPIVNADVAAAAAIAWTKINKTGAVLTDLGGTLPWSRITGTPTTLAGYGITDAAPLVHSHTFASITAKPTTLVGYGITDAQPLDAQLTALAALADAPGVLTNNGSGGLSWAAGGGGGTVTGTGTAGVLAKWTGSAAIGNSIVTESGSVISIAGSLTVGGGAAITSSDLVARINVNNIFTGYAQYIRQLGGDYPRLAFWRTTGGAGSASGGLDWYDDAGSGVLQLASNITVGVGWEFNTWNGAAWVNRANISTAGALKWGGGAAITSSALVPLLNAANTFTAANSFGGLTISAAGVVALAAGSYIRAAASTGFLVNNSANATTLLELQDGGTIRFFAGNGLPRWGINTSGDWCFGGSMNIADGVGTPTIAAGFGSGPAIVGTDYAFRVTLGSGSPVSGLVTFGRTYANPPVVSVCSSSAIVVVVASLTTTQLGLGFTGMAAGQSIWVLVRGY